MLNKIIFAIDNNTDFHTVAKFMRHIDTARAMGYMKGGIVMATGYWEGELEASYIMDEIDYRNGWGTQRTKLASCTFPQIHANLAPWNMVMAHQTKQSGQCVK